MEVLLEENTVENTVANFEYAGNLYEIYQEGNLFGLNKNGEKELGALLDILFAVKENGRYYFFFRFKGAKALGVASLNLKILAIDGQPPFRA